VSGVWVLRPDERDFPACLAELDERTPQAIYGVGAREVVTGIDPDRAVTIVGARRADPYGQGVAHELGFGAAAAGMVVVSGMALGCDSAAHEGALAAGGTTIAVLGNGPDVPYPRSKAALYRRILDEGGAVIGEQPPGTHPAPGLFPRRNRIMAALSGLTVVVEGAFRSGTRHTADEAARLGREVAAVPGQVTSRLSELPNDLLHDGAAVVRDAQDLLAVESGASTCDAVALATGSGGRGAAVALARLELMGYVAAGPDGRYTRTGLGVPRVD
jgi:DNA processing protein